MDLGNLISRAKWQEEEDIEDVKDNWDDDEPAPPPPPAENAAKKSTTSKGSNKSKSSSDQVSASGSDKPLTAQELREKRLMEEKLQKESEMKLTKQMLGMEDKDIALEFPLNTKEDFDKFHKNLVHKLWCYDKSPHYYLLLERLVRDLCASLESDELKNLSSTINALFNEKVKVQKAGKPKKKGVKGLAIKIERNNLDRQDYDELDDIM